MVGKRIRMERIMGRNSVSLVDLQEGSEVLVLPRKFWKAFWSAD
jgi:hypothetical protein